MCVTLLHISCVLHVHASCVFTLCLFNAPYCGGSVCMVLLGKRESSRPPPPPLSHSRKNGSSSCISEKHPAFSRKVSKGRLSMRMKCFVPQSPKGDKRKSFLVSMHIKTSCENLWLPCALIWCLFLSQIQNIKCLRTSVRASYLSTVL